jgi:hypothetical protein
MELLYDPQEKFTLLIPVAIVLGLYISMVLLLNLPVMVLPDILVMMNLQQVPHSEKISINYRILSTH